MVPKVCRDPGSETLVTFARAGVGGALAAGAVGATDVRCSATRSTTACELRRSRCSSTSAAWRSALRRRLERILRGVSSAPLVPGPLYGLRTWRVVIEDGRERLSAPQRGTPWTRGRGWIEATCGEDHAAPAAGCRCGIHAWHPRPRVGPADPAQPLRPAGHRRGRRRRRGPRGGLPRPARPPVRVRAPPGSQPVRDRAPGRRLRRRGPRPAPPRGAARRVPRASPRPPGADRRASSSAPEAIAERHRDRARRRRNDALRVAAALLVLAVVCALAVVLS